MILETIYKENVRVGNLSMEKEMPNNHGTSVLCPYIHTPFENCYCTSTSSLFAEATIYYCGGNYKDCEIYEKNSEEEGEKI